MKKIEITDLIGNDKRERQQKEHKSIDLPEIKQINKKATIYDTFYEITPENELEKCIQKIEKKTDYKQKTRQNIILAQFDGKMRRINKIKSKTYRKMRRKEKIIENLVEEDGKTNICPADMIKRHEQKKNEAETAILNAETSETNNENIDALKNKSSLLNKLLKQSKKEVKIQESCNVMSYKKEDMYEQKENVKGVSKECTNEFVEEKYEKQKTIVKNMFKECTNEFENEFVEEKKETIENEMPSIEKEVLPGWNSWGGAGIEVVETKYNTFIRRKEGISIEDRKDYKQSHVIINEKNKSIDEKYIPVLPYGYTEEDYKMKMDMPVSKEWNTLRMFNKLVRDESKNKEKEVFEYESKYL